MSRRVSVNNMVVSMVALAGSASGVIGGPFPATIELSILDGNDGFTLSGVAANDRSGFCVSPAGDVNGDGMDDLLIGAYRASPNGNTSAGETYVVFGAADLGAGGMVDLVMLNGANGFRINGVAPMDFSGFSVSAAGDVNGDGVDDLLIGAYGGSPNGQPRAGETFIVFGRVGLGTSGSLDLVALNGVSGCVIKGVAPGDLSGYSVSSAGDVNGDGVDDVVIGAWGADPNEQSTAGESYVVFGGIGLGASGSVDLSTLNGANGFVIKGIGANDHSGRAVSSAGDVNGDGVDDLVIGAPYASGGAPSGQSGAGEAYVVFGRAFLGAGGSIELSALDGVTGFAIKGVDANDRCGFFVSSAGDVNGDGVADLIIGALGADPGGRASAGESYVIFGGEAIGAGGSLNLSALNGASGFIVRGIHASDGSGVSVSTAGDVNHDGFDDVIIGAFRADPDGTSDAGEAYVVLGGACPVANGLLDPALTSLNGANGFAVHGINAGDVSGRSVSTAGDVNGDDIDDFLIGAPHAGAYAGESYVVFGRATSACCMNATICLDGLTASQCMKFSGAFIQFSNCKTLTCPGCVGDLNADGSTDIFDFGILAGDFGCTP